MNSQFERYAMTAVALAVTMTLAGCGGGSDSPETAHTDSVNGGGTITQTIDPTVLGQECLQAPAQGARSHVSASWIVPVQVDVVDVAGLGTQSFDGNAYPAIDVRNSKNFFFGEGEQHHTVYLHPQTPVLPAGAVTYAKPGSGGSDRRYRFDYAATSLSDLIASGKVPAAMASGGGVPWNSAMRANIQMTSPVLAGLATGQSRTYTMFKQAADGTGSYGLTFGGVVTELKFTYLGRENVAAPDGTYAQACKVAVEGQVLEYSYRNDGKVTIEPVFHGTVWLAPNVGPVRVALTDADENTPVLDLFLPAAR